MRLARWAAPGWPRTYLASVLPAAPAALLTGHGLGMWAGVLAGQLVLVPAYVVTLGIPLGRLAYWEYRYRSETLQLILLRSAMRRERRLCRSALRWDPHTYQV